MSTTTKFGLPGIYNTSLPTLNDQDGAALAIDVNGKVILGASTATIGAVVGNVASGATDSGNPVKTGAVYNSTLPTVTTGQRVDTQATSRGLALSSLGDKISGEDQTYDVMKVQTQMSYTNISASALIKSGAGQLAGFVVNSCGAGATLKLWDQTSAATPVLLNTMTFTAAVAQGPTVVTIPGSAGKFGTGLYATIAVAAMDVTFFYN